ncbi:MAG: FixH family protein [Acetobacteraceae bacterium]
MNSFFGAAVAALAVASISVAHAGSSEPLRTAADGYSFEYIGHPLQNGGIGKMHLMDSESVVFIRLVRTQDGMPVPNAKVQIDRVDMAPDGMGEMTALSYVRPYNNPGEYRVEIHPRMSGRWAVNLEAQVPGQAESIRQTLTVWLEK